MNEKNYITTKITFFEATSEIKIDWAGQEDGCIVLGVIWLKYNHNTCSWTVNANGRDMQFARMIMRKLFKNIELVGGITND